MVKQAISSIGGRKVALGVLYLLCVTTMGGMLIWNGDTGFGDLGGLASLATSMALGLGVVVWGNVETHKTSNGNS